MNQGLKRLAVVTTIVMFFVLLAGALVTNTGSADGCGAHWPLCHGTFMPDWDYEAIIEASHRGISTLAGLMSLVLAAWTWRAGRSRPLVRWLGVGTLFMVCLQGALGAMAVIWPQPKAVLALHFGISLLCFSGTVLLTTLLYAQEGRALAEPSPTFRRWVWTVSLYAYGVVYLGAYVRHVKASAACLGWPLCNGEVVPPLYGLTGVNFIHRVAAGLLAMMVLRLAFMAMQEERKDLRRAAWLAGGLVLAQVAGGALFGMGYINVATQQLHTALITLLWGSLTYLCLRVLPAGTAATPPALAGKRTGLAH
ncbi:MAG: heme oxygenase [Symbiobacteriaceae bacterium]|jgi:cytochrome c oxidase assembly protein subunit 15|nr:heme oxygenase [Symbiobacteriaceae bacterium]